MALTSTDAIPTWSPGGRAQGIAIVWWARPRFCLRRKAGDVEAMRLLLKLGADPKINTGVNITPLMAAAGIAWASNQDRASEEQVLEAVKLLVEELGADVNFVADTGETAMHAAAYRGANSVVQYLFDKGAKLDVVDKSGRTPLAIADGVEYGNSFAAQPQTAVLLRKLGAKEIPCPNLCPNLILEENLPPEEAKTPRRLSNETSFAAVVAVGCFFVAVRATGSPRTLSGRVADRQAVLSKYCFMCHNEKLKSGGLALSTLDLANLGKNPEKWEKVVRKLRTGAMPPGENAAPRQGDHGDHRLWNRDRARPGCARQSQSRPPVAAAPEPLRVSQCHPRSAGARYRRGFHAAGRRRRLRVRQ